MAYRRWLSTLAFEHPAQQIAFQDYVDAVTDGERRLKGVEDQILKLLPAWNLSPVVDALQAMRGIALVTAVVLVAEVGDFTRFANPRQLMPISGWSQGSDLAGKNAPRRDHQDRQQPRPTGLVEGALAYRMKPRSVGTRSIVSRRCQKRFATSPGKRRSACAPVTVSFLRVAKPPTSSLSHRARDGGLRLSIACMVQSTQKRRDQSTASERRRPNDSL